MSVNAGTAGRVGRLVAAAAAACAVPVLYARWGRPRLLTWGATADEVSRSYPGDELIPRASGGVFTMAATLPAPPEKVWPWLVQMGGDRAGFYSWDRLDHGGKPSADRIVPQWQSLQTGQRLNAEPAGQNWMTVEVAEPGRTLVLRENFELPSGHSFDPLPAVRPEVPGVPGWDLGLLPAPGPRRPDAPGGPYPRPHQPAAIHGSVQRAARRTLALHHADPPVPWPAHPGRRGTPSRDPIGGRGPAVMATSTEQLLAPPGAPGWV